MSILSSHFDYSDKDFESLRRRLISLVQSVFPDWSDFQTANFGNLLLEMYAFVGDVLTFYQDNLARESRLATATQRKNVMALAEMLGYRLHGAAAATAELEFRLETIPQREVRIPAGTIVKTKAVQKPVRFQLLTDVVFTPGLQPPMVIGLVEHSQSHRQLFDTSGEKNLSLSLDFGPFLEGSLEARVPAGNYRAVPHLLGSRPQDLHVELKTDEFDKANLRFGDGRNGLPPSGTLEVRYKAGGGVEGNVEANSLTELESAFMDAQGRAQQVIVTNPHPASGGVDRQSVAPAKVAARESLRALTRSVAREDFEINAKRLPGVARALMLTANEDSSIQEDAGDLSIVPVGGGLPTPALKNQVLRQVTENYPCTLTFQGRVMDPVYLPLNISARVFLKSGQSEPTVRRRIEEALRRLFGHTTDEGSPNRQVDFGYYLGEEIAWSDVFNIIRDTEGIRKIGDSAGDLTINRHSSDVRLRAREFPTLGVVSLINGATGGRF